MSIGVDLLNVLADFTADACAGGEERVIPRRGSIRIKPENDTGEVRVVRLGTAKLIVGCPGPNGPFGRFCSCPRRPTSPMKM